MREVLWEPQAKSTARMENLRYRLVLENLPVAAYTCDADGLITFFNRRAAELWGREPLLNEPVDRFCGSFRLFLPDGSPITPQQCWMARALHEGKEYCRQEIVIERPDGSRRTALAHATPFHDESGRVCGAVNVLVDIGDQKRAEQRLAAQHATTRILAESASLAEAAPQILRAVCESLGWQVAELWSVDKQAQVLRRAESWHSASTQAEGFADAGRLLALAPGGGMPGRIWASGQPAWVPDVTRDANFQRVRSAAEGGLHGAVGFPILLGNEVQGVMAFFSREIQEPDEPLLAMMTTIGSQIGQFIERKQTAQALQKEQEFQRAVLENVQDGIVACDSEGTLTLFNRASREYVAIPTERLRPEQWAEHYDFFLPDGKTRLAKEEIPLFRAFQGEEVRDAEIVIVPKQSPARTLVVSGQALWDSEGKKLGAVVVMHDLTERKRLEEQIRQSQKMEAVGQLAGGVAHDFNNLLTVINGFSEILIGRLQPGDPARNLLQEIQRAGDRAAGLTRQLLAFSRKQILEPKVLDLNAIVTDTGKMLSRLIGEDVFLASALAPGLRRVKVDPGQMEQVILNLAVNARDAMPTGGKLTVETANVDLDESHRAARPEVRPGRYVLLAVSDTGCGMTPEVLAHMFEPFFTTKGAGKGTGLGLATVYGIVKQSRGYVYVYSEPGGGTSFKIYLPAVEEAVTAGEAAHDVKGAPGGGETILLVEDEDAVRSVTRFALQSFGYTVLEASRGEEAVRVAERHQGPIHLLLTDVVMPGMGGRQVVERLARLRPGLKVLFLSGYTDDAVVRHGVLEAEVNFLQKPFTLGLLAGKVRKTLDH